MTKCIVVKNLKSGFQISWATAQYDILYQILMSPIWYKSYNGWYQYCWYLWYFAYIFELVDFLYHKPNIDTEPIVIWDFKPWLRWCNSFWMWSLKYFSFSWATALYSILNIRYRLYWLNKLYTGHRIPDTRQYNAIWY